MRILGGKQGRQCPARALERRGRGLHGRRSIREQQCTQIEIDEFPQQRQALVHGVAVHAFRCVQVATHAGILRTTARKHEGHFAFRRRSIVNQH